VGDDITMATNKRCADTAHDFDKFDDATIYCRKCGEQSPGNFDLCWNCGTSLT